MRSRRFLMVRRKGGNVRSEACRFRLLLGMVNLGEIQPEKGYTTRSSLRISEHFHAAPDVPEGTSRLTMPCGLCAASVHFRPRQDRR